MKATRYYGDGDIRVDDIPEPTIEQPTDALVRVTLASVCGTDLHYYRSGEALGFPEAMRTGHEFVGTVEAVGPEVQGLQPGDRVLGSPTIVDGTCRYCREGLFPCESGTGAFGFSPAFWPWGGEIQGAQSEIVRVPLASGTLTKMPEAVSGAEHDPLMLTVVDVMSTGWHCATAAALKAGDATLVIGDGAVGLCAVHAAALKGAAQVICLGHHDDRLAIAEQLGATTVINSRDNSEVRERVMQLTRGEGVPAVLQTISGTTMELSQTCARHGGVISCVGADQFVGKAVEVDWVDQFMRNLTITGGITPFKRYRQELAGLGAEGRLKSNLVFTHTLPLKDAPEGYRMMAERAEGVVKVALSPEG